MDPVSVSVVISRPVEEVYEYLADIANHSEFSDHYMVDWHLTREDSYGIGAGAQFKMPAPLTRFPWGDMTFIEMERPRRIVEGGRTGKYNRIRTLGVYELEPTGAERATRVTFTYESAPPMITDRFLESLGARRRLKRRNKRAMNRLRSILEDGTERGKRVTIAGGARKPATDTRH